MRRSERAGPRGGERGYVTAEAAVVIPALVVLAAVLIAGLGAGAAQIQCVDAARAGAREAARSETPADVQRAARQAAPPGARVSVRRTGDLVTVSVSAPAPHLPMTLSARAVALAEDTLGGGDEP